MDVIILGGGIIGLTMANLLARIANLQITLVEEKPPALEWDKTGYDLRCSAIALASSNIFSHLDVWDAMVADRVSLYDKMQVWHTNAEASINFAAAEVSQASLGHIIENRVMQRALRIKLAQYANVRICCGRAHKLDQGQDVNRLYVDDYQLEASLIIGADGANSWLRASANIAIDGWDYQHSALVATIKSEYPHNRTAMQRFVADGPLAFLPLTESNASSIVWSSTPERIENLRHLPPNEFCDILAKEFGFKLGALELQGERASFPLRMLHAKNYVQPRIALIGDAAHVIHPLAGQGMNLGIMDAAVLAEVIQQALTNKLDIGRQSVLRNYERSRKGHNLGMIALVEALKNSYKVLSRFNMSLVNNFSLAKKYMICFAMGVTGDVPDSAKFSVN